MLTHHCPHWKSHIKISFMGILGLSPIFRFSSNIKTCSIPTDVVAPVPTSRRPDHRSCGKSSHRSSSPEWSFRRWRVVTRPPIGSRRVHVMQNVGPRWRIWYLYPWRIHGAGIYANIKGVYWWDPCYHIYQHHGSVMGYKYYKCYKNIWMKICCSLCNPSGAMVWPLDDPAELNDPEVSEASEWRE